MKGLNKFLKNKNTVTILGVLACIAILFVGYNMRINQKTALVTVYYANQTIQPKTKITEEMVSRAQVPESLIKGSYYQNYKDIVGKYSNYNTMIAEGSLFYSDLLVEESNLPDAMLYDVNEGERIISFPVDVSSTYGNSIMPGNMVDIYVKLINNKKIIYGEMFENIEVLGVKDGSGKNVFEDQTEKDWITVSYEEAIKREPDVILIHDYDSPSVEEKKKEIKTKPVLSKLDCVKNDKFATIELESVLPGDRMAYTVEKLAKAFYPDLFE